MAAAESAGPAEVAALFAATPARAGATFISFSRPRACGVGPEKRGLCAGKAMSPSLVAARHRGEASRPERGRVAQGLRDCGRCRCNQREVRSDRQRDFRYRRSVRRFAHRRRLSWSRRKPRSGSPDRRPCTSAPARRCRASAESIFRRSCVRTSQVPSLRQGVELILRARRRQLIFLVLLLLGYRRTRNRASLRPNLSRVPGPRDQ